MKHNFYTSSLLVIAPLLLLGSCIRDEALNAECDIVAVQQEWLDAQKAEGLFIGEPIVKNERVQFVVKSGADRTALAPVFVLTDGASIQPANGTVRDFTLPQTYTTFSADGQWQKDYTVSFNYPIAISQLSFEHFALDARGQYYGYYEVDPNDPDDPRRDYWDSGNAGYALTGRAKKPEDYPTTPYAIGVQGNCARLETLTTGTFGQMAGMPIAAGNLFIGEFDVMNAMKRPREATHFGRQLVTARPLRLEGWYKYTAGPQFQDINRVIHPEKADTCDIYAVLYEVDPLDFVPLNGDDVLSSERIVSMARIDDPGEPQEWTFFSEEFRPMNGKTFDPERCARDGYAIAVVLTSSRQGAYFEGAIGSVLYADEIRIVWDEEQ